MKKKKRTKTVIKGLTKKEKAEKVEKPKKKQRTEKEKEKEVVKIVDMNQDDNEVQAVDKRRPQINKFYSLFISCF